MRRHIMYIAVSLLLLATACTKTDNEPEVLKIDIKEQLIGKKWVTQTMHPTYKCVDQRIEFVFNADGTGTRTVYGSNQIRRFFNSESFTWIHQLSDNAVKTTFQDKGTLTFQGAQMKEGAVMITTLPDKSEYHRELGEEIDYATLKGNFYTKGLTIESSLSKLGNLDFSNYTLVLKTKDGFIEWGAGMYPYTGVSWGIGFKDPHLYLYAECDLKSYTHFVHWSETPEPPVKITSLDGTTLNFPIGEVFHDALGNRRIVVYDKEYSFNN